ncbi:hypothetical protein B4135_0260 [Caldibacillus debilis]|uniref:Uncharacterized protein n=1 Tax=Caldibacillus debilis TaxID=301148 RepID=A0A150M9B7_9BACI|nr:hypothetical protein B4135_0260 [Caldibacillus debilis]
MPLSSSSPPVTLDKDGAILQNSTNIFIYVDGTRAKMFQFD